MCVQYMEVNSFVQLAVNFHSNRWSGFRDFMFTVLENVVSGKLLQFLEFWGPVALKIRRRDVASGICKHPKTFLKIFRVTYPPLNQYVNAFRWPAFPKQIEYYITWNGNIVFVEIYSKSAMRRFRYFSFSLMQCIFVRHPLIFVIILQ